MVNRLKKLIRDFEKTLIKKQLQKQDWNQVEVARYFGIHRKTLEYLMKNLQIKRPVGRGRGRRPKKK